MLVVRSGTTKGLLRGEEALVAALARCGVDVCEVRPAYRLKRALWPLVRRRLATIDLVEALASRWAVTAGLLRLAPRATIYATTHSAMLQPARRIGPRTAIRFDSPARLSRTGRAARVEHALERRRFRRARLLLPWGLDPTPELLAALPPATPVVALPVPVADEPGIVRAAPGARRPLALTYAANPWKKGLDVVVEAWCLAAPEGMELAVTGIEADEGRAFLAAQGVPEPRGLRWVGHLERSAFRALTGTALVYLAGSRYEDHGLAQLEALLDGALLVTVPSDGPYEPLRIARELDPRLVARERSASALADALRAAVALEPTEHERYVRRARQDVGRHSDAELEERLRSQVLPVLLDLQASSPS